MSGLDYEIVAKCEKLSTAVHQRQRYGESVYDRRSIRIKEFMNTKLYVGNLPFSMEESDIKELFSESGNVTSVHVALDRESGRKRGFAFVEMENEAGATEAISSLNRYSVDGRQIVVNMSRPRNDAR